MIEKERRAFLSRARKGPAKDLGLDSWGQRLHSFEILNYIS